MRTWILLIAICLLSSPVRAGEATDKAEKLLKQMEYGKALKVANQLITSAKSGPRDIVAAYRIKGLCLSAQGSPDEAMEAFSFLLVIKPGFELSDEISPKLAAPFYQAMAMVKGQKPIKLAHKVKKPKGPLAGKALSVVLQSNPFDLVHSIRLRYVSNKKKHQVVATVKGIGPVQVELPKDLGSGQLEYFFEAVNQHGAVLVRAGSPQKPYVVDVSAPMVADTSKTTTGNDPGAAKKEPGEKTADSDQASRVVASTGQSDSLRDDEDDSGAAAAWYETWWFWTAVGAVVVAGAATGTALALTSDSGPGAGDPVDYSVGYGVR